MKRIAKSLDSLKDSRIMFEKQPPAFGYVLIFIVSIFFTCVIVWSMKTPKMYMIQAQGTVTNTESNYVMCSYTGEIENCNMQEGTLVNDGDTLFTVKSTDYNLQQKQLTESRKIYKKQIEKYKLLVQAIKGDTNYFDASNPDDELYYNTFEKYKAQVSRNTLDTSTYQSYGYSEEQIEAELVKNQGKISEIYYSAIENAENSIKEAKLQIASIDSQLSAIKRGQKAYEVKATSSGVLHLLENYKDGMVVQTTTTVATITPENSKRVIEAYVSTADMARMNEGDEVQIVIDGLSQAVYGTVSGTVRQIDSNVTAKEDENGVNQVFKILVDMNTDYVISQSGDKVDIVNGMTATARICYDKVTYFNYVLEKLGFKAK